MTPKTHTQSRLPVSIRSLKVTTMLRLHPDFCLSIVRLPANTVWT
jgi:hypothetical protein